MGRNSGPDRIGCGGGVAVCTARAQSKGHLAPGSGGHADIRQNPHGAPAPHEELPACLAVLKSRTSRHAPLPPLSSARFLPPSTLG